MIFSPVSKSGKRNIFMTTAIMKKQSHFWPCFFQPSVRLSRHCLRVWSRTKLILLRRCTSYFCSTCQGSIHLRIIGSPQLSPMVIKCQQLIYSLYKSSYQRHIQSIICSINSGYLDAFRQILFYLIASLKLQNCFEKHPCQRNRYYLSLQCE